MSTRSSLDHRASTDDHGPTAGHDDGPGVYLTDEVFLYRLAGSMPRGTAEAVELEDCYALDVVEVSLSDLRARGLRIVTPSAGDVRAQPPASDV